MIKLKERFQCSESVLVQSSDRPICIIDYNGLETYNELREDDDKTRFLGVDDI